MLILSDSRLVFCAWGVILTSTDSFRMSAMALIVLCSSSCARIEACNCAQHLNASFFEFRSEAQP